MFDKVKSGALVCVVCGRVVAVENGRTTLRTEGGESQQ